MFKNALKGVSVIVGVLFLFGCTTSPKDVEVRRYVEIRDRVDQNMEDGNAGYLAGTPQPEDRSGFKKTRKIYVVEVSEGEKLEDETAVDMEDNYHEDNMGYDGPMLGEESSRRAPVFSPPPSNYIEVSEDDMEDEDMVESSSVVEYTVQKDDTLQKISKKFYDSFSKWTKIYDKNRDVISNPDRIKPGTVLQVPVE